MSIISEGENKNIHFSSGKRWFRVKPVNGNLCIEYKFDEKKYIITRTDGMPFDGLTEDVGATFSGNMKAPKTLDEVIEHEVNSLASMQIEPEVSMFNEFDWGFNEDKTKIIVCPVFLEECTNVIVHLPYPFGSEIELSVGTVKRVRNGNIDLSGENILKLGKN